jgi:hypothetical protein
MEEFAVEFRCTLKLAGLFESLCQAKLCLRIRRLSRKGARCPCEPQQYEEPASEGPDRSWCLPQNGVFC